MAVRRRSLLLALGPLAGVPWVLLALVARSSIAGELMSYYGFPLMIGLCWPMIAGQSGLGGDRRLALLKCVANLVLSVVLFAFSGGMHDRRPWQSFGMPNLGRIAATEAVLDTILANREQLGPMIVDDAVGALRPSGFHRSELRPLMNFSDAEIQAVQVVVFQPVPWLAVRKAQIIAQANLVWHYGIPGTSLRLYSRHPLHGFDILVPIE